MKKLIIALLLVSLVAAFTVGCKSREAQKLPPKNAEPVTDFYLVPLPQFAEILAGLDFLKNADFDKAVSNTVYTTEEEVSKSSFALGVLTADGILAVKARNKTKLTAISKNMIKESKFIGIDENVLKLADELQSLIAADKWTELETALDKYKADVEASLFESKRYDLFTMMQLGGWTEGLNRTTYLINLKYQPEKSTLVDQKGIMNALIDNMGKVKNESITGSANFKLAQTNYARIKEIIYAPVNNAYTKEQITELNKLTQDIKDAYQAK